MAYDPRMLEHLTPKQLAWAEELTTRAKFNPREAARLAGYASPDIGTANLSNELLMEYALSLIEKELDDRAITRERVLDEITSIAFSNITDVVDLDDKGNIVLSCSRLSELPRAVQCAIESFEVTEHHEGFEVLEVVDDDGNTYDRVEQKISRKFKVKMHDKKAFLQMLALATRAITHDGGFGAGVGAHGGYTGVVIHGRGEVDDE